ncbi:MAG: tripartite tricarboxylate transporter substrate binding protein [Polaromonas sp.]|nr:tripartite tricarboxylate transporter substrate binding protein [Polaromonas sp.]
MKRRSLIHSAVALALPLALGTAALPAWAQDKYPSKNITYLVPFPAGGTTDILARLISQKLGAALGTSLVIDNPGGAGGSIGSEQGSRAPADGYTLVGGTISSHAINVSLYPRLGYDPVKSFTPIVLIGSNPVILVVGEKSPYKTLQDVLAAAKAKPRTISSASAGSGTSQHMALEMLGFKSGTQFIHVPYKGSGPAITDVISGQVDMMFDTSVVAAQHINSGKLRALAVSSSRRLEAFPNVPTVAESGVPGFEVTSWQGLFVPAGTPRPIVDKLHEEVMKILQTAEFQERLKGLGMQGSAMTPAQVTEFQKNEVEKWAQVIKAAGIKLD